MVVVSTTPIDLTPFGFTPTENTVYSQLLRGGPAGGYSISKDLLLARANAYQALRGLVAKGAAVLTGEDPQRFRAIRPVDLYARIVERESSRLDQLESQLGTIEVVGASAFIPLSNERAFLDLAARAATREPDGITCIAPARFVTALVPALRKRAADRLTTSIWIVGDPAGVSLPSEGSIPLERAIAFFRSPVAILIAGDSALLGRVEERVVTGYWTSDPAVVGATRGTVAALISGES
jgi:sugar-specific transcriptional regulator TrmB